MPGMRPSQQDEAPQGSVLLRAVEPHVPITGAGAGAGLRGAQPMLTVQAVGVGQGTGL